MYGKITLGKRGTILLKICLMLSNFGTCCFYFKILGGLSLSLVEMFFELKNQFYASPDFYMWVFFFLIGPLVFLTNINSLNNTAFIGVLSIIILFISIIILFTYKVMTLDIPAIDTKLVFFPNGNFLDLFACFASIFDSFTYKHNFFPIYLALRPRNNHSMKVATLSAIIFCIFLFSSLGILCFLMYGYDFVDIIDVFKKEILYYMKHNIYLCMLLVTVVVTYIIASVLTLPLVFFSVKKNCINLCIIAKKKYFTSEKEQNNNAEAEYTVTISGINPITDTTISQCSKHIITALLYTSVLVCTLYIKQIISISNAMGSTTSNAVMILFPCFFLIKLDGSGKKHYIPKFFLLFGFATLIVYFVTEGYKILRDAHLIHL